MMQRAATKAGIQELPEAMPGAHEWQLWTDNPALVPDQATVDPLSLILSMQHILDDRVGRNKGATSMVK